jgi:hypothetical protein
MGDLLSGYPESSLSQATSCVLPFSLSILSFFTSTAFSLFHGASSNLPSSLSPIRNQRNLITGTSDVDCDAGHVVCLAGYHCKNVGKDNYACSGTSSLRPPKIFSILSQLHQILLTLFGSTKALVWWTSAAPQQFDAACGAWHAPGPLYTRYCSA